MRISRDARFVTISTIVAFMLVVMPLPEWLEPFRPDWVTLIMIYWVMMLPSHVGVVIAWMMGILLDVAHGALMGEHALGLVLVAWFVFMQHQRMRVASLLQQALVIFFLLLSKQLIVLWVNGIIGRAPDTLFYFAPSFLGALLWPWFNIIVRDLHHKFRHKAFFR